MEFKQYGVIKNYESIEYKPYINPFSYDLSQKGISADSNIYDINNNVIYLKTQNTQNTIYIHEIARHMRSK